MGGRSNSVLLSSYGRSVEKEKHAYSIKELMKLINDCDIYMVFNVSSIFIYKTIEGMCYLFLYLVCVQTEIKMYLYMSLVQMSLVKEDVSVDPEIFKSCFIFINTLNNKIKCTLLCHCFAAQYFCCQLYLFFLSVLFI